MIKKRVQACFLHCYAMEGIERDFNQNTRSRNLVCQHSMKQDLDTVNLCFTKQHVHIGHDTVTKMRSLDPSIHLYPCFEDEAFQECMTCNIPYCILHLILYFTFNVVYINYTVNVKSPPLTKDVTIFILLYLYTLL
jgi:hypothetical protein